MRVDFVGRAVHDVDPSPVTLPARDSRSEMFVRIGDAPVVFFLVFVFFRVGSGVAALPEGFDKVIALFVIRELLKGGSFLVGDNPDYVLVQPLLIGFAEFDVQVSFLLLLLFFRGCALQGIGLIRRLRLGAGWGGGGVLIARSGGLVGLGAG